MLSYNAKLNSCTTKCHCNSSHDHSGHVKSLADSLPTVAMLALKPWLTLYGSDYVLTECSRVLGYIQGLGFVHHGCCCTDGVDSLASDSDGDKSENHAEAAFSAAVQSGDGTSEEETSEEASDE